MKKPNSIRLVLFLLWVTVILSLVMVFRYDAKLVLGIIVLVIIATVVKIESFKNAVYAILMTVILLSVVKVIAFSYGFTMAFFPALLPVNIISVLLFITLITTRKK